MTGLVWLALLAVVILCSIIATKVEYRWNVHYVYGNISFIMAWVAGIILFIGLIAWPFKWVRNRSLEAEFRAVQETITETRKIDETFLERVALTQKVVDMNGKLGPLKYWNDTVLDWYIPDSLAKLEYIK